MRATRSEKTVAGVPGFQFQTSAAYYSGSPSEVALQAIQLKLADGDQWPGDRDPHLFPDTVKDGPDDPGRSLVGLWVPSDQRSEAERLLAAAGFTVHVPD